MSHAKISKRALAAAAAARPAGYLAAVLGAADYETATHLVLPAAAYASLLARYRRGPGTELKALLASFGITASPTCSCNKMASQMDAWGPEESLKHIEQIVDVMQETATARRLPFLRAAGRKLVRIACARARKKSAQPGQ